jgi:uncharacterized membrane protein YfcA
VESLLEILGVVCFGFIVGVMAGLLGQGGGILFVVGLVLIFGLDQHHAIATSLLAIIPAAFVAVVRQSRRGYVQWRSGITIGVVGSVGVAMGVVGANRLSGSVLRWAFIAFLLILAVRMILHGLKKEPVVGSEED